MVDIFFNFKRQLYYLSPDYNEKTYMSTHPSLDAYTLEINGSIEAILFASCSASTVYLENLSYNPIYSKYNLGTLVYYLTILKLIENKMSVLYLGAGDFEYKQRWGTLKHTVYDGYIPRKIWGKVVRIIVNCLFLRILSSMSPHISNGTLENLRRFYFFVRYGLIRKR